MPLNGCSSQVVVTDCWVYVQFVSLILRPRETVNSTVERSVVVWTGLLCGVVVQVIELSWDYVHGWAGMGGTRLGTTRSVVLLLSICKWVNLDVYRLVCQWQWQWMRRWVYIWHSVRSDIVVVSNASLCVITHWQMSLSVTSNVVVSLAELCFAVSALTTNERSLLASEQSRLPVEAEAHQSWPPRHCWLGVRKSIRPVKNRVMRCWHCSLSEVRCKCFTYGPADATATPSSLASLQSRLV